MVQESPCSEDDAGLRVLFPNVKNSATRFLGYSQRRQRWVLTYAGGFKA
jgi:hypothetical protein